MKRYEEYRASSIPWTNRIPAHWTVQRAKFLYQKEQRPVREEDAVVTCFRDGTVTLRKNRRTTGFTEAISEFGYQGIRKGDLVIHVMDAFAGAIGVSDSDGKGTPVYNVCTACGDSNNYYYAYALREMARAGFIQSLYRGIRERSSDFRFDIFARQYLPVPPRAEQDQIVRYLDWQVSKINRLIAAKRKQIDLLQAKRQKELSHVMQYGLCIDDPVKDTGLRWIGESPVRWRITALKRCATLRSGITLGKQYAHGTKLISVPYLRVANVQTGYVDTSDIAILDVTEEEAVQYQLPTGCVLMTEGGDRDKLGRGCVWDDSVYPCIHQNHVFAVVTNDKLLSNRYLEYLSASDIGRIYFDITAIRTTNLACTNATKVLNFTFPLPERDEQERIILYLDKEMGNYDVLTNDIKREIELLQDLRIRLISDVVTGQVDVRGIEVPEYEVVQDIAEEQEEELEETMEEV